MVRFNDLENVIALGMVPIDFGIIPLKLQVPHPVTQKIIVVHYRGVSTKGRPIIRYSQGNKAGEALGG